MPRRSRSTRATAERPEDRARLAAPVAAWRRRRGRRLSRRVSRNHARHLVLSRATTRWRRELIRLFGIEKVLYEVRYELAHRRDWVRIPLAALLGHVQDPGSTL